jgi:transcription antitermination factor NusG
VVVTSGPFADFGGVVLESGGGGRVKVQLDIFGKQTEVDLPPDALAPP